MGKAYGKGFSLISYCFFRSLVSFFLFHHLGYAFLLAKQPISSFSSSPFCPCTTLSCTGGRQAGKDSVKFAPSEGQRQDTAIEARAGARLPAPGHCLWITGPCLCWGRKKHGQKLQLMSRTAPPFFPTSASSPEARAAQLQVWRHSGDFASMLLFYFLTSQLNHTDKK